MKISFPLDFKIAYFLNMPGRCQKITVMGSNLTEINPWKLIKVFINHHQSVLPKVRFFAASAGTNVAVLTKAGLPPQTQEPRLQFYRWGSFPLFSAPHSLISTWTHFKRSEKFPRAATWRWGVWIWLTGTSGLQRNSQQGLNIMVLTRSEIRKTQAPFAHTQ